MRLAHLSLVIAVPGSSAMPGDPPGMEPDLVTLERNSFNFLE
jgi:hypothetical protein